MPISADNHQFQQQDKTLSAHWNLATFVVLIYNNGTLLAVL